MAKEVVKLIGEVNQEQIDAWKKRHGEVHSIVVEGHIGYLKAFDRKTAFLALSYVDISKAMNMERLARIGEVALQNCWLGGSEEIRTNDSLFITAAVTAGELLDLKGVELKKL